MCERELWTVEEAPGTPGFLLLLIFVLCFLSFNLFYLLFIFYFTVFAFLHLKQFLVSSCLLSVLLHNFFLMIYGHIYCKKEKENIIKEKK